MAGLAIVLGIALNMHTDRSISGTGPFGTHLSPVRHGNHWKLRLTHQRRQFDHEAQYGSGYSTLFAKHMACNCLPVDLDNTIKTIKRELKIVDTVRTIHVGSDFLNWVRGTEFAQAVRAANSIPEEQRAPDYELSPLMEDMHTCQQLQYLYRLPSAHKIDAYCYVPDLTDPPQLEVKDGEEKSKNSGGRYTLHWFNAVAKIAFGGLVPQAGTSLITAVLWTVTGETREDCEYEEAVVEQKAESEELRGRDNTAPTDRGTQVRTRMKRTHSCVIAAGVGMPPLTRYHSHSHEQRPSIANRAPMPMATVPAYRGSDMTGQAMQANTCSAITMALQQLVDALAHDCVQFTLFGEYVYRRAHQTTKWMDTDCSIPTTARDAGALFSRYMTALERLVAKSLFQNIQRERDAAKAPAANGHWYEAHPSTDHDEFTEAEKSKQRFMETQLTQLWAVGQAAAKLLEKGRPDLPTEVEGQVYVKKIYQECAQQLFENFVKDRKAFNLAAAVKEGTNKVRGYKFVKEELPDGTVRHRKQCLSDEECKIEVEDCAQVARCIIAGWALRVPFIELEWEYSGRHSDNVAFNELPSIVAFG